VRFSDAGLLSSWMRSPTFDVDALVDACGNVPWPLMQASFHMLRPTLGLSKAVSLLDRAWDDRFLDGFLALERWGSDNVSFPGECFRRYAHDLYRDDAFANGRFRLAGKPARMESIEKPLLAITFEHDNIVPWKSAALLVERAKSNDKDRWHLSGGHVGAVVSRHASETLWPRLSAWWAERDAREARAAA
jgi:polyhydroxyalkanoate synthase